MSTNHRSGHCRDSDGTAPGGPVPKPSTDPEEQLAKQRGFRRGAVVGQRLRSGSEKVFRPGPDRELYYGWRIVRAGSLMQMLVAGLFLQAYGAYVVLLQADLGWSMTMLSAGFALARTESAVLGPVQGWLIDRFGPRTIMRIGVGMFGTGFILLSMIQRPWQFFVAIIILALGASFAGYLTVVVAVVNWFQRRRATALGITSAGFALGGLLVPVVATFLSAYGWRAGALTSGIVMLILGPLAVQVVRHRPSELGLHVDGIAPTPEAMETSDGSDGGAAPTRSSPRQDFTAKQALRTAAFWQISLGHGLAVMLVSALMVHLIPHLTGELGYSLGFAGLVVSLVTMMQLLGQLFGGYFGDRRSKKTIVVVAMAMHCGAAIVLTVARSPVLVVLFAVLHGVAWGARGPLLQAWRADFFGTASFGAIMGFSSVVVMLGAAGGPLIAGMLFDHFGDYVITLRILSASSALGGTLFFLVRKPVLPASATPGSPS